MNTHDEKDHVVRNKDFFNLSVFSFGSCAFSTPMSAVVFPVLILNIVANEQKNSYLGLLGLTGLIVALLAQAMAGYASDRTYFAWGRRTPYVLIGSLVSCVSVFALGIVSTFTMLIVAVVIVQIGINGALGPYNALIKDLMPASRRGIVSSFKVLGDGSGGVTSLILASFLLSLYQDPDTKLWLWISIGVLSIALGLSSIWTFVKIGRIEIANLSLVHNIRTEGEDISYHPHFIWFLASRFCTFAALSIFQTYALFFLQDVVGVMNPPRAVGVMSVVVGISLLVAVYPFAKLSDVIGRKWVMIGSMIVGSIGAISLLFASDFSHVIAISIFLGAAVGAYLSTSWAMATDFVSYARTAQQMALSNAASVCGAILAYAMGPFIDLFNAMGDGLGYSILLVVCGVFFMIGALLLSPVSTIGIDDVDH